VNHARLQLLIGRVFYDVAAAQTAPLVSAGSEHGLYAALAARGTGAAELARLKGLDERFVRSWLLNQAAAGYISYDAGSDTYSLDAEQRELFANPDGDWSMVGAFDFAVALAKRSAVDESRMPEIVARLDPGKPRRVVRWLQHLHQLLTSGASVLEIGSGTGDVLLHLSELFPQSTFLGLDSNPAATAVAEAERVRRGARARFQSGDRVPDGQFDVVLTIDTLHDIPGPERFASAVRDALRADGYWIIAEMKAGNDVTENLNPVGRALAAVDALYCFPASGMARGALTGERGLRAILDSAGFNDVRIVDDPQRLVLEARR